MSRVKVCFRLRRVTNPLQIQHARQGETCHRGSIHSSTTVREGNPQENITEGNPPNTYPIGNLSYSQIVSNSTTETVLNISVLLDYNFKSRIRAEGTQM